jgi:hypothetical protein
MQTPMSLLAIALVASPLIARAADAPFSVQIQIGPVEGVPTSTRSVSFEQAARKQRRVFDVQDGREHNVRGVALRALLAAANAPKAADTAIVVYSDGMQIPVHLADKPTVDAVFIAFEHGDAMDRFTARYPLLGRQMELGCPKVVYGRNVGKAYSIWRYPAEFSAIKLVTWKAHEAALAQPTRRLPDRSGWPLYLKHCQPCHGLGGQGAARGSDFLTDLEAYRRIPANAETGWDEHPSLHEKVKGFVDGTMPVLDHVSSAEIATLWKWLHAVHRGATK